MTRQKLFLKRNFKPPYQASAASPADDLYGGQPPKALTINSQEFQQIQEHYL